MSKRKILIIVSCIYLAIAAIGILPAIYTTRETVTDTDVSKEYFIDAADNPIEKQEDGQCSAYAAAYVMRYCGDDTHGSELYPNVDRILGAALPSNVVQLFRDHGYQAKAYHGDLSTLKTRLNEGVPIIVCLRDENKTHYAVLTGYDETHLYLADPTPENASADNKNYNRIIENEEFLAIWKSGFPISDNVYIVATKKR